ncbi:MAG: 4a-hydroxytetrahydrobiopterin dehydratase [bacterium]|nr:4a-hydroxytetrahydrobiopterin dehydratase [bacterium]
MDCMDTWEEKGNFLHKTFIFKDFKEALAFVNQVGEIAERLQHHPDISISNYKEVSISTTTHSENNKVTEKDYALAKEINSLEHLHK